MYCNRSKSGACRHLSFLKNPVFVNFMQSDVLVPNYSVESFETKQI